MGASITTTYRIEMAGGGYYWSGSCWFTNPRPSIRREADGPATDAGLAAYMDRFLDSMRPGGCNAHLGIESAPRTARLVRQSSGEVVATWQQPMFVVLAESEPAETVAVA